MSVNSHNLATAEAQRTFSPSFSFPRFLTQASVSFSPMNIHELTLEQNAVQLNDINELNCYSGNKCLRLSFQHKGLCCGMSQFHLTFTMLFFDFVSIYCLTLSLCSVSDQRCSCMYCCVPSASSSCHLLPSSVLQQVCLTSTVQHTRYN